MPELSKAVDFLTVMSYDYHGSWESQTGHVSPLTGDDKDKYPQYNSDYAMQLLVKMGASKEKLILGVPFYGQTFTLAQNRKDIVQGYGSQSSGPGEPGEFTNQPGMMSYNEICYKIKKNKWKTGTDPTGKAGPYATKADQWVGYDDVVAMITKAKYVIKSGFGGIGAWTVDLDDFQNRCCLEPFPLLRAINREFGRITTKAPAGSDCTRPTEPVTPVPAVMTTTVDTGAGGIPVTSEKPYQTSTSNSYTTTMRSTTTKKPTTTKRTTTTTTTQRPVYANKPTTTQRPVYAGTTESSATLPVPANVMPVVINGAGCETGEYRRHPQNCNAYYRCVNDELIQQYCAGGLHWNDAASLCDWPSSAKCSVDNGGMPAEPMTTTTRQTTSWQTTKKPVRQTTTVRPTTQPTTTQRTTTQRATTQRTTTQRVQTTTRRPSWQTTTARPTYYNPPTTTAALIDTTTTKKPQKRPASKCNNGQYYPSKACDKFFICVNNKKVKQSCPPGLQWSQEITQCDWEDNVKCISRKKYLRILTNQALNLGTSMNAAFLRAVAGDPCNGQNYVAYPGHCSEYLICNWEKLYASQCPNELQWNDNAKACDWAERSTCASKDEIDQDYDEEYEDEEEEEEDEEITDEEEDNSENQIPDFSFAPDNSIVSVQPSSTTTTKRPTTTTKRPTTTTKRTTTTRMTTTTRRPTTSAPIAVEDSVSPLTGPYKLVCYFTNWAWYRKGLGKYTPDNIDTNLCTHIVYGFAVLNYDELTIRTHDSWADIDNKFYSRVVAAKEKGVKVTLAIGGWNDSAGDKYSRLVRSAASRAKFIKHVVEFLEKYGFDGLDLDWEYPVCWQVDCKKGNPDEKEYFTTFVRELSEEFVPRGLLLSSAVSPSKTVIDAGYDVPALSEYFDWIAVMCYDYHGQWDKKTGHVAPLYYHPDDEIDFFNTVRIL